MGSELSLPKANFLYKTFVDQNIKQLFETETIWEKFLTKASVNALNIRYYREQYIDIETPNDATMSAPIDEILRSPYYRAPGDIFPHTSFGEPLEYNLGLYQLALEVDIPDEAQKYGELENRMLKSQEKLGNSFISKVNKILGDAISETWSAASINATTLSSGEEWDQGAVTATCRPIKNVLDAAELIDDIAGYNYKPTTLVLPKQSYYDLRLWVAEKNYQYIERPIGPVTKVLQVEGIDIISSNMVKRDNGLMGDFRAAGVLYESEPFNTRQYYTDADRITHLQAARTFNYALTDPKAICLITNLVS